jgi:phage FluMu protein Com
MPGFDIITSEAKIIEIKCPRCGAINLVSSELFEKVMVKLK